LDGLLKGELPNATLGDSAVARVRAVNEGNAFNCPHLGSGAEAWVKSTVLVKLTRTYLIGIFKGFWHINVKDQATASGKR
jgi:hypothetical protein